MRGLSEDRAADTQESSSVATGRPDTVASTGMPHDHTERNGSGVDAPAGGGDLCLSMAIGISPAQLVTFAVSFREVAPVARLVMFFEAPTSDRFNEIIEK